jgi:hypothetical protein
VISRETRRLLLTIFVAVAALWVLTRLRFQERPVPSPVPNVFDQLRPSSSYADLARLVADIRPGIVAAVSRSAGGSPALRIRDDAAVTLTPGPADTVVAADRATGLSIVRHAHGDTPALMPWAPRLLDYPRYLLAADVTGDHVAPRPVFVGGLFTATSVLWSGELWLLPVATAIAPGTFVFTTDGALAGLAVSHEGHPAIVPAALLSRAIDEMQRPQGDAGELGITIQALSPALASATGAQLGVVVTAIVAGGPSDGKLVPTEVIEAVDGEEIRSLDHWRVRAARASAGDVLTLRVRGAGGVRDVPVTAEARMPAAEPDEASTLGLRLRSVPRVGVEVLSVEPRSRGAQAGIQVGDLITVAAGDPSPTSAQVVQSFASLARGASFLLAISRGSERRVIAIEK